MKALITGPRSRMFKHPEKDYVLPYLSLETEFEELPQVGEKIIINNGGSVVVKNRMWWVDGPDTPEAYSYNGGKYEGPGEVTGVHLQVEPPDWGSDFPYDEGFKAGKKAAADSLSRLLRLTENVDNPDDLRSIFAGWIAHDVEAV